MIPVNAVFPDEKINLTLGLYYPLTLNPKTTPYDDNASKKRTSPGPIRIVFYRNVGTLWILSDGGHPFSFFA